MISHISAAPPATGASCYVELLGPARLLAGRKVIPLDIPLPSTVPQLVGALAEACPALVRAVLDPERGSLVDGYILNRNGRDFLKDATALIQPGDHLLLMSSSAGG